MRLREVHLRAFGGVANLDLELGPGINVVIGDNESGKTTLFNAIRHVLLTPTNLDKRALKREMDPFFPRPDGNFAEVSVTAEEAGRVTVRRRWGADAEEEAFLEDGTTVRGPADVDKAIDRLLPVSRATYRALLLADQSQLDQTARLLDEDPTARDEAASSLRAARLAAGGVSPEAFTRLLDDRLAALVGRWDLETDRPEGERGHNEAWIKGAGTVVKSYYEYSRLQGELDAILQSEARLEESRALLEQTGATLRSRDEFVTRHAAVYAELNKVRGLDGEIAAAEQSMKSLREANRRWPLLQRDAVDTQERVRQLTESRAELEAELGAARDRDVVAASAEKLERLATVFAELEEARTALEAGPLPDESALDELRAVEAELPFAEARLASGSLRASVTATGPGTVTFTADAGEAQTHETARGGSLELHASRRLVIETPDFVVQVESGEEKFEDVRDARDKLRADQLRLQAALGAGSAAEADSARRGHLAALTRVKDLEHDVLRTAGVSDLDEAVAARDELARLASGAETPAASPVPGIEARPQAAITNDIRDISQKLGSADGQLQHTRDELEKLTTEYGTQDNLENLLGETNRRLAEHVAKRDGNRAVPDGYETVDAFLAAYEERKAEREVSARANEDARVAYAELLGSQPDQTSEELRAAIDEARLAHERLRRDAHTLDRVRRRSRQVIEEMDSTVFDPFVERVAELAGVATGDNYVPLTDPGDPLRPRTFTRARHRALAFELLSQGTRDSLALAVRVALAETVLGSGSAPFILDDPLVDMDPGRRAAGADILNRFAARHQVIIMTCHPEHVPLFPRANVIQLQATMYD